MMNTTQLLFMAVLFCAVVVNARYHERSPEQDPSKEFRPSGSEDFRDDHARHRQRHKRNFGHYYQEPYNPWSPVSQNTCPEREMLAQMMKIMTLMLEKQASSNVYVTCGSQPSSEVMPSVNKRYKPDDPNRNWGFHQDDKKTTVDYNLYTRRPINLEPYVPDSYKSQDKNDLDDFTTKSPFPQTPTPERNPDVCDFAYVTCCDKADKNKRQNCFVGLGCQREAPVDACDPQAKKEAFNILVKSYGMIDD